ncbi:MAG: hypothetical protein HY927_02145 [Elusimicrobia bacterium]|nr:hypothetical protein [Elusimicrobiota bacterium]
MRAWVRILAVVGAVLPWSGGRAPAQEIQELAEKVEELPMLLKPIKAISLGRTSWGHDGYFELLWQHDAQGSVSGADVSSSGRELWVASQGGASELLLTRLDAEGKVLGKHSHHRKALKFRLWETGGKEPLFVGMDGFRLWQFDLKGATVDFDIPKTGVAGFTVVPKELGGPFVAAAYQYGGAGLRAFQKGGKLAWELPEIERAGNAALDFAGRRPVLTASNGTGKIYVVGLQGTVLERIQAEGNTDRVLFDQDEDGQWMYALDSQAGSWTETLGVSRAERGRAPGERRWEPVSTEELGRFTVTAWCLGSFDAGPRRLVVGTDTGWVLVLDRRGKVLSQSRFRGKVLSLAAKDLNRDRKEELIVATEGYGGGLFVYTRP